LPVESKSKKIFLETQKKRKEKKMRQKKLKIVKEGRKEGTASRQTHNFPTQTNGGEGTTIS